VDRSEQLHDWLSCVGLI